MSRRQRRIEAERNHGATKKALRQESIEDGLSHAQAEMRESRGTIEAAMKQVLAPVLEERERLRKELREAREASLQSGLEALLDTRDVLDSGDIVGVELVVENQGDAVIRTSNRSSSSASVNLT